MVISVLETYPLTYSLLQNALSERTYGNKVKLTSRITKSDILISDERYFYHENLETCLFLLPSDTKTVNSINAKHILFCGMKREDSVTFSSISEDKAMICLQKEIEFMKMKISPFETSVFFDRNYSITKNILAGFTITLLDLYFGEDKWKKNLV